MTAFGMAVAVFVGALVLLGLVCVLCYHLWDDEDATAACVVAAMLGLLGLALTIAAGIGMDDAWKEAKAKNGLTIIFELPCAKAPAERPLGPTL